MLYADEAGKIFLGFQDESEVQNFTIESGEQLPDDYAANLNYLWYGST